MIDETKPRPTGPEYQLPDEYKKHFIFVDKENSEIKEELRKMDQALNDFAASFFGLCETFDYAAKSELAHYAEIRNLSVGFVSSFSIAIALQLKAELIQLSQEGRMTFQPLVGTVGYGSSPNAGQLKAGVERVLYGLVIKNHWDKILIACQKFKQFPDVLKRPGLVGEERIDYDKMLPEIEERLKKANAALRTLGITPIEINFTERLDPKLAPYVLYTAESQRARLADYYLGFTKGPPEAVLDAENWAYLNSKGELWAKEKARVTVLSNREDWSN